MPCPGPVALVRGGAGAGGRGGRERGKEDWRGGGGGVGAGRGLERREEDGVLRESAGECEAKVWRKAPKPRNRLPVLLMIFQ